MRFLACIVFAVALIAVAFHLARPLPSTNFDESFLPKPSYVRYIAAGNDASVAGLFWIKGLTELGESYLTGKEYAYLSHVANLCTELDSLFYTPYYFVGSITPSGSKDTTDFVVMRRAMRLYPEEWRLAVGFALRLSKGPYPDKQAAADVMRPYFDSPDTTIPPHIRTMYRSFELDNEQTEVAVEMILNDVMQPRFKNFRTSFYNKMMRALGYKKIMKDGEKDEYYEKVKNLLDGVIAGQIHPALAYRELLAMKIVEEPKAETISDSTKMAADSSAAVDTLKIKE